MFIVLLKFAHNRGLAGQFMDGHKQWLQHGFDEGVFLMAGSILPSSGGVIIAHRTSLDALRERVHADPFVAEGVVDAEILPIAPSRLDERLRFMTEAGAAA